MSSTFNIIIIFLIVYSVPFTFTHEINHAESKWFILVYIISNTLLDNSIFFPTFNV